MAATADAKPQPTAAEKMGTLRSTVEDAVSKVLVEKLDPVTTGIASLGEQVAALQTAMAMIDMRLSTVSTTGGSERKRAAASKATSKDDKKSPTNSLLYFVDLFVSDEKQREELIANHPPPAPPKTKTGVDLYKYQARAIWKLLSASSKKEYNDKFKQSKENHTREETPLAEDDGGDGGDAGDGKATDDADGTADGPALEADEDEQKEKAAPALLATNGDAAAAAKPAAAKATAAKAASAKPPAAKNGGKAPLKKG